MAFTLSPYETRQYFDNNGDPLSGGFVFTFQAGTSVPAVTYKDAIGTPNTNPIVLDAGGRCVIYLDALSYKFIIEDVNSVVISTTDPVQSTAVASGGGVVGSILYALEGDAQTPIVATVYVAGNTVDTTHAGTNLYTIDSASIPPGTYALQAMIAGTGGANTVSVSLMDLDTAPNTPLATASGSSATGIQTTSLAIVFSAPGTSHRYGVKTIVSAGVGYAWSCNLIRIL